MTSVPDSPATEAKTQWQLTYESTQQAYLTTAALPYHTLRHLVPYLSEEEFQERLYAHAPPDTPKTFWLVGPPLLRRDVVHLYTITDSSNARDLFCGAYHVYHSCILASTQVSYDEVPSDMRQRVRDDSLRAIQYVKTQAWAPTVSYTGLETLTLILLDLATDRAQGIIVSVLRTPFQQLCTYTDRPFSAILDTDIQIADSRPVTRLELRYQAINYSHHYCSRCSGRCYRANGYTYCCSCEASSGDQPVPTWAVEPVTSSLPVSMIQLLRQQHAYEFPVDPLLARQKDYRAWLSTLPYTKTPEPPESLRVFDFEDR